MDWDNRFVERSPLLVPLMELAESLRACDSWPRLPDLQALVAARGVTNATGVALRLVGPAVRRDGAMSYEARVYGNAELEVREGEWHDLFNVLAWLAYPKTKARLNALHCMTAERRQCATSAHFSEAAGERGPLRDALTLFDESGMVVASTDRALLDDVREFRWKTLFCERRQRVRENMSFLVFGHALCEKALRPYVGMTAHAVLLEVDPDLLGACRRLPVTVLDELLADLVGDPARFSNPRALAPVPVLGVPDCWPDNEDPAFYDNAHYFRAGRLRASAP